MSCSQNCTELYDSVLKKLLKMSMVPIPCQEYHLSRNGCTRLESIEWVLDLEDKVPVWSRLNATNTSGYNRKLPMSMCKNYDIEIKGRLWSLWGQAEYKKSCKRKNSIMDKSYLATTVVGLCAARVFRLNIWNSQLMDCIAVNGRTFYKNSLKKFCGKKCKFQLEDLGKKCTLEGLNFKICMKTVQQGRLYCTPFHGCPNLAYALINFLADYQFGLLECFNRILGFGFIAGPEGGYFMFDAQSMGNPLFPKNTSTPYLLRTNHLQILLYCLVVAINCFNMNANFSIHDVNIELINPDMPTCRCDPCKRNIQQSECILPEECWQIPSIPSETSSTNLYDKIAETKQLFSTEKPKSECVPKYRRKSYNISKTQVEKSIIKPLIDADHGSDENLKECSDFLKIICSETRVPLTKAEQAKITGKSFVVDLHDALVSGARNCKLLPF